VLPPPTASAITYGQALSASTLSGGTGSVAGAFAFTSPTNAPAAGTANQSVTFTPADAANYVAVVFSVSVTVNKADTGTTVVSSRNPSVHGESVTFRATVSSDVAMPTGSVQFKTNGVAFGGAVVLDVLGTASSAALSDLPVGTHSITVLYSGDANLNGSTNTLSGGQTVESVPTFFSLSMRVDGSTAVIEWQGSNSWFYTVEFSPSLLLPVQWMGLSGYENIVGVDGTMSAVDTNTAVKTRFYRVKMTR
jgi:hypothetical protein